MLDRTLTPEQRRLHVAAAGLMLLLALACCFNVVAEWLIEPHTVKYVLAFNGLTAVALVFVASQFVRGAWTGVVNRQTVGRLATGVGAALVGLLGLFSIVTVRQMPEWLRDDARIFGLLLLGFAALAWVQHTILQSEARIAEKLLEIELRLAELPTPQGPPRHQHETISDSAGLRQVTE
jgi:hypothetical protein